jgi:hypothetical protein
LADSIKKIMAEATNTSQQVLLSVATATATMAQAIKAREQIVKDVMSEIPKRDRGKLMAIAINRTLDTKISFVDCLVLFSLMVKTGHADVDKPKHFEFELSRFGYSCSQIDFKIDVDGRITKLDYGAYELEPHHFPAGIGRLERLTVLYIYKFLSLPGKELSSLRHLQTLSLNKCYDDFYFFPVDMKLDKLKRLEVDWCDFKSSSSLFFTWMSKQISNLEHLVFDDMEEKPMDIVLDVLRGNDFSFQNKLKSISIHGIFFHDGNKAVNGNHLLETLMVEIVPKFPDLTALDLQRNKIESVQPTVDRIINKDDKPRIIPKSLCIVDLRGNPVMTKMKKGDSKENSALIRFLQIFSTVYNLEGSKKSDYCSDLEYALRINHAGGRTIIAEDGSSISNRDGNTTSALPLSVWPTVLERSYEKSRHVYNQDSSIREEKNATGLYDLLRNSGLTLLTRPNKSSGNSGQSPASSLASSASSNGDGDIGEKQSSKRKRVEVLEITNGIDDDNEKNNTTAATFLSTTGRKNHSPSSKHSCSRRG